MVFLVSESSRVITLLSSDSKLKRKESLTAIERDCDENIQHASVEEIRSYCSWVIPHLVNLVADPVESYREGSLRILSKLCECVDVSDCFIPYVTQMLVKRLTVKESLEESEEVRLCSMKLLNGILQKLQNGSSCVDDYCLILSHSLMDSFHEVKVLCCDILQVLAVKFPSLFYHSAEPILKPLLNNIVHQQHKVRVATVEAVGVVFEHCNGKFVDYTIAPLTQRLFDSSIAVRKAVIRVVGEWLLNLMDRYSYQSKLIPLILSGYIDECEEIRNEAAALWEDVGLKFEKENENDLKDKIDFDPGKQLHYPPNQARPNFGCRELLSRTASRLLPGLCNDLRDWQEATRHKAAGLLPIVLFHIESGVTQHTQLLVTGLANGIAEALLRITSATGSGSIHLILMSPPRGLPCLSDITASRKLNSCVPVAPNAETSEALGVLQQLFAAARYVACFVEPEMWWKLLCENSRRCLEATSPASLASNYFLLANLIAGSCVDSLVSIDTDSAATNAALVRCFCPLLRITAFLTAEEQITCSSFASKAGILECANALISFLGELLERRGAEMVKSVVTCDGAPEGELKNISLKLLEDIFFLLMSVSACWEEGVERTEFVVEFNDQVGRLLCCLSRHQSALLRLDRHDAAVYEKPHSEGQMSEEAREDLIVTEAKRAGLLLERLYGHQLPKLLRRLDESRRREGSHGGNGGGGWHAKSMGLYIFCHAVLAAGPGLLLGLEPLECRGCGGDRLAELSTLPSANEGITSSSLYLTLRMLEEGCRLGQPIDTTAAANGKGGGPKVASSPLSIAAEAELHLKGLLLLMRLTEHARLRIVLTQPRLFRYCLERLILPSCVWRAGRTSEAMRKAAATSLVALLAAVVPLAPPSPTSATIEGPNARERLLDEWIDQRIAPTKGKLSELLAKNGLLSCRIRFINPPAPATRNVVDTRQLANLGLVSAASPRLLSLLLARLGGLLTDDLEATRLLACTGLALLFGGLYAGGSEDAVGSSCATNGDNKNLPSAFLRSPAWFLPLLGDASVGVEEVDIKGYGDKMPGLMTPLPGSLGDKVYRFYPCLLKALDDASDEVRLRAADVLVTWFWVMEPNLVDRPPPVPKHSMEVSNDATSCKQLNPVYSAVIEDLTTTVTVHLDDADGIIRAAVARVILRIARVSPETVRKVMLGARERHRSPELCEALLGSLEWSWD
ncbi:Dynein assembly factor 5 axonemal [Taenia crassiceps]|uniref:Dynein assembly factor 5 axonemal n=1 Tax=Taenia crassiceps TaxID=6207 RepID=A0ABR4Q2C9_9CEST